MTYLLGLCIGFILGSLAGSLAMIAWYRLRSAVSPTPGRPHP